ncbi:unnamed protein product [Vitrella brassicaformis CCMP3155]|uniref:Yippee domain-containing protein n=2 Tax=Vitrella brassicaformis TaxID=1169539 RepID=A0A0G4F0X2_VITBC|nr:unnamed protein product [Vitrella brassicaformis CCMP3155]|mmetsp:Transcript_41065/g.102586  ORF Transcript_41065/g.102586 Transcript_41065/m.102586 type:complete len:114 (+) Transcript_41065:132-473(+)|eukprot:CEM05173.1 unnamed protein product [Vitrella brassicaformis CCMP3155]
MGRLFIQYYDKTTAHRCTTCGTHITAKQLVNWIGVMGQRQPAKNYGDCINVDFSSDFEQTLSSGTYTLRSVYCRVCRNYLGWKYVASGTGDPGNKEKEGTYMLLDDNLEPIEV